MEGQLKDIPQDVEEMYLLGIREELWKGVFSSSVLAEPMLGAPNWCLRFHPTVQNGNVRVQIS